LFLAKKEQHGMVTGYSAAVVSANGVNGKPRFARKTAVKTGGVGGWDNCP